MNYNNHRFSGLSPLRPIALAAAVLLAVLVSSASGGRGSAVQTAPAQQGRRSPGKAFHAKPKIFPGDSLPLGKSYADWSAEWCLWAFSLPAENHPFFDETGEHASQGQSGSVWFLVGAFNDSGTVVRHCAIPHKTALFVPVMNAECFSFEIFGMAVSQQDLADCAKSVIDLTTDVSVQKDNVLLTDLQPFRAMSPLVELVCPDNNIFGLPAGNASLVADGYYIMIAPLAVGEHTLRFKGTFSDIGWSQDVTYHLSILPHKD